jgi:hypothetical protein
VICWLWQIFLFDIPVIYCLGLQGALYFLLSTFFAGSIHPTAGAAPLFSFV